MKQQADQLAQTAKQAAAVIGNAATAAKNAALADFAARLTAAGADIIAANARDLAAAEQNNIDQALRERLHFDEQRLAAAVTGVKDIIALPDPIGSIDALRPMPSGISVGQMRVPIGTLLMIYESRPNVTIDAAALALKAGNAVILRGGSEARHTNAAIADCLSAALNAHGLAQAAQVVRDSSRDLVGQLLQCEQHIDLIIPRGGRALIERVARETHIAVLKHLDGNCHVYIDAAADIDQACAITENSKTRRYGVCNAAESLLIHADIAATALPPIAAALARHGVEMRGCGQTRRHLAGTTLPLGEATEEDWAREYLAPIISIKVVPDLEAAIAHINRYGSAHSDAIVSNNAAACRRFVRAVDSSSVLVNAATGFADGGEYGLGAEIGISTGKLHTRGPVGLIGLTTRKYIVLGSGQCRQ